MPCCSRWHAFSFGYFVGFYFYTMVVNYLWLNSFTDLNYDHRLGGISAAASAVAFLLPALFITAPLRQIWILTPAQFDRLLTAILLSAATVIAVGASYNFRLVAIQDIYDFRDKMASPRLLNYLTGMISSALLPFALAGFAARKAYWQAGVVLVLLLCLYPITLSKAALCQPAVDFLVAKTVRGQDRGDPFPAWTAAAPAWTLVFLLGGHGGPTFPSSICGWSRFRRSRSTSAPTFSRHDLTHFCQISFSRNISSPAPIRNRCRW